MSIKVKVLGVMYMHIFFFFFETYIASAVWTEHICIEN